MTPDPHADLRATIEFVEQARKIPMGSRDAAERGVVAKWLYHSPALVRALLAERDDLAERDASAKRHDYAEMTLRAERDALKAEVERLRAKPVTPEQLFSSSKVIWEGWVRARDEEAGCVLDLFNGRVDRSRYVRVVEADQPQKPVHHKWPADPVEPAKPAEPISDELRLRCELAGRLIPAWVVEGHFNNHNVTNVEVAKVAHNIADALIAEARRRKEAGK